MFPPIPIPALHRQLALAVPGLPAYEGACLRRGLRRPLSAAAAPRDRIFLRGCTEEIGPSAHDAPCIPLLCTAAVVPSPPRAFLELCSPLSESPHGLVRPAWRVGSSWCFLTVVGAHGLEQSWYPVLLLGGLLPPLGILPGPAPRALGGTHWVPHSCVHCIPPLGSEWIAAGTWFLLRIMLASSACCVQSKKMQQSLP